MNFKVLVKLSGEFSEISFVSFPISRTSQPWLCLMYQKLTKVLHVHLTASSTDNVRQKLNGGILLKLHRSQINPTMQAVESFYIGSLL